MLFFVWVNTKTYTLSSIVRSSILAAPCLCFRIQPCFMFFCRTCAATLVVILLSINYVVLIVSFSHKIKKTDVYFSWSAEIRQNFDELSTAWLIDIYPIVKLVLPPEVGSIAWKKQRAKFNKGGGVTTVEWPWWSFYFSLSLTSWQNYKATCKQW